MPSRSSGGERLRSAVTQRFVNAATVTEPSELVVGTITIRRVLVDDRDLVTTEAVDAGGDALPLVEALGLLRLAEDTVIRESMGEVPDDEDDYEDDD